MLDQHTKIKEEISQVLDLEFIQNQIDNNSLDFDVTINYKITLLTINLNNN